MVETVQLRKEDVFLVNHLAHKIWPIAFKDILSKDQIDYMLDWMYDVNTLEEQVQVGHFVLCCKGKRCGKRFLRSRTQLSRR